MSFSSSLCDRVQASIRRTVEIQDLSCVQEDGQMVVRGNVPTRDEAFLCNVILRMVPGVRNVVNEVRVAKG